MYEIYIGTFLGLAIAFALGLKYLGEEKAYLVILLIAAGGANLGALSGMFVAMCIGKNLPRHSVTAGPATLVAMRTSDSASGTFVLGSGSINSQPQYHFYVRNEDGTFTPYQIPADTSVHISEDKTLKNVGYWQTVTEEDQVSDAMKNWVFRVREPVVVSQNLRVPAGTVVQAFSAK